MANPNDPACMEDGVRIKKVVDGENFYFYVSSNCILCTIPRENDPRMSETRKKVEAACDLLNELLEKRG